MAEIERPKFKPGMLVRVTDLYTKRFAELGTVIKPDAVDGLIEVSIRGEYELYADDQIEEVLR